MDTYQVYLAIVIVLIILFVVVANAKNLYPFDKDGDPTKDAPKNPHEGDCYQGPKGRWWCYRKQSWRLDRRCDCCHHHKD